jgi:hypothetical protein
MGVVLLILALETPALLALLDCINRGGGDFAEGDEDRKAWIKWLIVGVLTAWILVGNGIVLGYYYAVIRRNTPMRPG